MHDAGCRVLIEPREPSTCVTASDSSDSPSLKFGIDVIVDWIIKVDRRLVHQTPLWTAYQLATAIKTFFVHLTRSISIVFCLPLSAKLLMYIRVALLRASAIAPAKDIFPYLVNEDFKAPVPA